MAYFELQSKGHRQLLDSIDRLRSQGMSKYVELPEIVVCGDQSSGKSSVLEAISGLSFPAKDQLCTRFATELVLRRAPSVGARVSITPCPDRSPKEKERLDKFTATLDPDNPQLGQVIEDAKSAMGLSEMHVFGTDTLHVEMHGPGQPHLTLVDLPGLFVAGDSGQSDEDAEIVKRMVRKYMARRRSIVLAVVSAMSGLVLQQVTRLARELDPGGTRTLGLITKPDTLDAGSESEAYYMRLAQNREVEFHLGWHVLKNRGFGMRDASSKERDDAERDFFAERWSGLDPSCLGISSLRPRLSNVLKTHILRQVPDLIQDVNGHIEESKEALERLGDPLTNIHQQRRFLLQLSQKFTELIRISVDGLYNSDYFGPAEHDEGYGKRLRAVVQNQLTTFQEDMRNNGQHRIILSDDSPILASPSQKKGRYMSWSTYRSQVEVLMRRTRGCELPGTFNPLIIGELFKTQCQPWPSIAESLRAKTMLYIQLAITLIVQHVAVGEVADGVLQLISTRLGVLESRATAKIGELLDVYRASHPITYDQALMDNARKASDQRREDALRQAISTAMGCESSDPLPDSWSHVNVSTLFEQLRSQLQVGTEHYASDMAIDYMQAYYEVARKRFVDNVSTLGIEMCLLRELPGLFDPATIYDLTDEEVSLLVAEKASVTANRHQLREKLRILEEGLTELKGLNMHLAANHDTALAHTSGKEGDKHAEASTLRAQSSISSSPNEEDTAGTPEDVSIPSDEGSFIEPMPMPSLEQEPDFVPVEKPTIDDVPASSLSTKKSRKLMKKKKMSSEVTESSVAPMESLDHY